MVAPGAPKLTRTGTRLLLPAGGVRSEHVRSPLKTLSPVTFEHNLPNTCYLPSPLMLGVLGTHKNESFCRIYDTGCWACPHWWRRIHQPAGALSSNDTRSIREEMSCTTALPAAVVLQTSRLAAHPLHELRRGYLGRGSEDSTCRKQQTGLLHVNAFTLTPPCP